jgi:hypothetical protein
VIAAASKHEHNLFPDVGILLPNLCIVAAEFSKETKAGLTSIFVTHLNQSAPWLLPTTSLSGYPLSCDNVWPFIL